MAGQFEEQGELQVASDGTLAVDSFYKPFPKQDLIHTSPAPNLLTIGGNGSGKSMTLLGEGLYNLLEYPGCHVLLLRKTFRELEKGLIRDFLDTVPRQLYKWNGSKYFATFDNEAKLFFGHCATGSEKDLSQYLSARFVFIGIDELGQFSYDAWSFLTSRNGVNRGCRPSAEGYMPYCRMGGATNPLGPGYGWIKKLWIDHKPVSQLGKVEKRDDGVYYGETHGGIIPVYDPKEYFFVHSTVLDNPAQMERDPDYINKLARLAPPLRQKALYGDLNSVAGTYFQNFTQDKHVLSLPRDHDLIQWQTWQPIWISIDWGLAHHSVIYWHTRAKVRSVLDPRVWKPAVVTIRELIVNEMSHREVCKAIREKTPDNEVERVRFVFLSPERFARSTDPDNRHTVANEMGDELKLLGLPRPTRANDRRVDGAVFMYNLIDAEEYFVLAQCEELINALETRVRDDKNLEDVLKVDDIGDDCYDSDRYGLMSMLGEKGKPEEVKLEERLAKIEDPTARRIAAYEHYIKSQKKTKGAFQPKIGSRLRNK
jgi:hypothetical protein